jgi:hypothetical protein
MINRCCPVICISNWMKGFPRGWRTLARNSPHFLFRQAKAFLPRESDPAFFDGLLHALGGLSDVQFEDIFSLDETNFHGGRVVAYLLVLPAKEDYEAEME